jgi:hypothetical protein
MAIPANTSLYVIPTEAYLEWKQKYLRIFLEVCFGRKADA